MSHDLNVAACTELRACRVCGSNHLTPVLGLGDQCIGGVFPTAGTGAKQNRFPLELVRCDPEADPGACGLVQLRHSVPAHLLYDSYWYRSGINQTMTGNLHEIADQASELLGGLTEGDLVIDVGCNDGTLLDGYANSATEGVTFLGVDPSDVARYAVAKGYQVVNDFFSFETIKSSLPNRKASIITSIAMFYDLEDPNAFVRDIAATLSDEGVWVSEFSYMPTMLALKSFDTICHEHLEYYSLSVIERIFESNDLSVLRAELNDVNGGSIRLFAGRSGSRSPSTLDQDRLEELRRQESNLELGSAAPYTAFASGVLAIKADLRALLGDLKSQGRTIHIYGASTKGNTILQYVGVDPSLVVLAADRNPDKWGTETIGTGIPIVSEEESRGLNPDYYLVLPWHFLPEMLEREAAFFDRGGRFIVPLPEVRIVDGRGHAV